MKNYLTLVVLALVLGSCADKTKKQEKEVPVESVSKSLELPDSLFKLKDQKITFMVKNFEFEEEGFKTMDSIQKMKLLGNIPGLISKGKATEGFFVSSQNKIGNMHPIIVYGATENYAALLQLNLDELNNVIGYKEIAGGFCDAPVQYDDRIQWCDEKVSTVLNDTLLELVHVHQHSPSYERVNEKYIDSVKYLFKILPSGKFEQIKRDSTRYFKVVKK
jgi:hypothetical protein